MCSGIYLGDGTDFTQLAKCPCLLTNVSSLCLAAATYLFKYLQNAHCKQTNVNLEQMPKYILEKIAHDCRPVTTPLAGTFLLAHVVTTCS